MSRYIYITDDCLMDIAYEHMDDAALIGLQNALEEIPTADVIEADNVQKTVETYCTDHCYHNAHCMEMHKDVDDAVEYLERKCEKCPLRDLRDLDM